MMQMIHNYLFASYVIAKYKIYRQVHMFMFMKCTKKAILGSNENDEYKIELDQTVLRKKGTNKVGD